jgi:hypothetical protein
MNQKTLLDFFSVGARRYLRYNDHCSAEVYVPFFFVANSRAESIVAKAHQVM